MENKTAVQQIEEYINLRIESLEDLNKDIPTGFDGGIRELKHLKDMIKSDFKPKEDIQHRAIWRAGKFGRIKFDINEEFNLNK